MGQRNSSCTAQTLVTTKLRFENMSHPQSAPCEGEIIKLPEQTKLSLGSIVTMHIIRMSSNMYVHEKIFHAEFLVTLLAPKHDYDIVEYYIFISFKVH